MINENVNSIPECLDSKNSNSLEINLDKKEPLNKDEEVSSTKSSDELKSEKSFNENNSNIAVVDDEESCSNLSDNESDLDNDLNQDNIPEYNENFVNNKFYVTNMKTKEELESESKLVTEKEIYNLGINQALINKEEEEFKHKFEKLKSIINDSDYLKDINSFIEDIIKNKKYLVLQSTLNNHIDYIKILDSVIFKNEKNIQKLKEEKVDLDTQVDDLFDETESLNNKIDKNEERISNLRNKCTSKNQKFKILLYLSIFLNINSFLIGHIGFINYSKNIYQYSVDIYNISYFVLSNILNYSLLIFSNSITLYISFGLLILCKIYIFYKNNTKKLI